MKFLKVVVEAGSWEVQPLAMRFRGSLCEMRGAAVGAAVGVAFFFSGVGFALEEAPMLRAAVLAGKVPNVDERVPRNPLIVMPQDRPGEYGGTLRLVFQGAGDLAWVERVLAGESLVRWDASWSKIVPNLAASWSVNSNATEYVFHLRRGVRWSDGAPFTAEDVVFWNREIFRSGIAVPQPSLQWLSAGGKLVEVEARDEATVVFRFEAPNGFLLHGLAGLMGDEPVSYPKHYLERFTPSFNAEGIPSLLAAERVSDWKELVRRRIGSGGDVKWKHRWQAAELPRLTAWQLVPGFAFGQTNRIVAERNPFYWKVDTAGRQLPYIDRVEFSVMGDRALMVAAALRGEVDFGERALTSVAGIRQLREGAEAGGLHLNRIISDAGNMAAICVNLNHTNAVRRALYRNKDFRIALSLATDREQIIREVLGAPGEPRQMAPKSESPMFSKRLASQYTVLDRAKAEALLDGAGLAGRDAEGWRVCSNGARLSLALQVASAHGSRVAAMRLVKEQWARVGIFAEVVSLDAAVFISLRQRNAHDVMVWSGDGGMDVIMDPRFYLPVSDESLFGVRWSKWFTAPRDPFAEEPPPTVRRQMELYRAVRATPDVIVQQSLMRQVLDIAAEEFFVIGLCTADDIPLLVKNNLRNVPKLMFSSGRSFPAPSPYNPCQFYFDPPAKEEVPRP